MGVGLARNVGQTCLQGCKMKYRVGDKIRINEPKIGVYAYNTDIEEILRKTNRILTITEEVTNGNGLDTTPGYYVKEMGLKYIWYDKDIKCLVELEKSDPIENRWSILDIR
jgi:hypothetical protein